MKALPVRFLAAAVVIVFCLPVGPARAAEPQLAHMVYFTLNEKTDAAREKLVAACKKYLAGHEGTAYFSVGVLAQDLDRDVNDRDFDVALHIVFKNKAAHDTYQTHERHLQFIEVNKELWSKVRVFDSYVEAPERDDTATGSIPLPDPAAHFAGMIRGKVVHKRDGQVVVVVDEVQKEWETSKAENAKALVGKKVLVTGAKTEAEPVQAVARFLASLKVGEIVTLDVAHKKGEALTILELTEDQKERAGK